MKATHVECHDIIWMQTQGKWRLSFLPLASMKDLSKINAERKASVMQRDEIGTQTDNEGNVGDALLSCQFVSLANLNAVSYDRDESWLGKLTHLAASDKLRLGSLYVESI